ncbi:response regulator [Caulobacter sp. S45]|uniref:response regulator n=1 Tax=Caulobacter sp. S45 TaxID=1641861 RepID=UPI00131B5B89|nr:response regulator [Caulobacter sp. S45]
MRILIVEDEALVAMLLEDMLADLGHTAVFSAASTTEALAYMSQNPDAFDFAITDVNLAGEQSYPIAEALAAAGKPFAFATGYGPGSLPEAWRDRPVLAKPFGTSDVARVVGPA